MMLIAAVSGAMPWFGWFQIGRARLEPCTPLSHVPEQMSVWQQLVVSCGMRLRSADTGQAMIMPGVRVGHGDGGPGCFTPTHEPAVTNGQLFGWEVRHVCILLHVVMQHLSTV